MGKVLVVGDVILDHYWFGDVTRISPEAPVPVIKIEHEEYRVGGAGNVAANATAQGAVSTLLSVIGPDKDGAELRYLLAHTPHVLVTGLYNKTVSKLRIVAGRQQMIRIDRETPPTQDDLGRLSEAYDALMPKHDVVVFSDYDKGTLTEQNLPRMIRQATDLGKLVFVDPKKPSFAAYEGASVITPNMHEFISAAGPSLKDRSDEGIRECAYTLMFNHNISNILLTRGADGMTLFMGDGQHYNIRAEAREVFDVTGAGDTVVATMAARVATGKSLLSAATLANKAAGIAVERFGAAVITSADIFS